MENVLSGRLGYGLSGAVFYAATPQRYVQNAFALLERVGLTAHADKRAMLSQAVSDSASVSHARWSKTRTASG
ncbi:hypothetical protein ACFS3B_10195 [Brucella rhizosphaerae]|uniref:hypothetical protein n=1 Tax=Brucella rhizosphaerae TaxID=571254 RepID=UPI00362C9337